MFANGKWKWIRKENLAESKKESDSGSTGVIPLASIGICIGVGRGTLLV
jgi:hypothetical protein